jgi:hypothetical protein
MADKIVEARNFYAKHLNNRVWIVFKTKRDPWRGLFLDFTLHSKEWASPQIVRSMKTGKLWIERSAQRRRRGSVKWEGLIEDDSEVINDI